MAKGNYSIRYNPDKLREMIAKGMTAKEITKAFKISPYTLREHLTMLQELATKIYVINGLSNYFPAEKQKVKKALQTFYTDQVNRSQDLSSRLEELTGLESRMTILGYVQRGGTPSARDRLLGSMLGGYAASMIAEGEYGKMVSIKGQGIKPVGLKTVVDKRKLVPVDHLWIETARRVGTCLGDGNL